MVTASRSNPCPRCTGTGYFGPQHVAGGRCFRCGRAAGAARAAATGWSRASVITALHNYVLAARSQGADWAPAYDAEALAQVRALLALADADVRARALAALPSFVGAEAA